MKSIYILIFATLFGLLGLPLPTKQAQDSISSYIVVNIYLAAGIAIKSIAGNSKSEDDDARL